MKKKVINNKARLFIIIGTPVGLRISREAPHARSRILQQVSSCLMASRTATMSFSSASSDAWPIIWDTEDAAAETCDSRVFFFFSFFFVSLSISLPVAVHAWTYSARLDPVAKVVWTAAPHALPQMINCTSVLRLQRLFIILINAVLAFRLNSATDDDILSFLPKVCYTSEMCSNNYIGSLFILKLVH